MNNYRPFGYVFKGADPDELMRLVGVATQHSEWTARMQRQHKEIREILDKLGPE